MGDIGLAHAGCPRRGGVGGCSDAGARAGRGGRVLRVAKDPVPRSSLVASRMRREGGSPTPGQAQHSG